LIITIFFLILERKSEVQLDKSRNLINAFAKKESDLFVMSFTRQLLTDDSTEDINLGKVSEKPIDQGRQTQGPRNIFGPPEPLKWSVANVKGFI
jgi:hypothetical protein